jgi:NAD(P)-dependent dehydrogenase (short-subunit alcohol dehydrogenase family)
MQRGDEIEGRTAPVNASLRRSPRDGWLGLAGRGALITGGAQGIGHAIARRFLEAGAHVVVIDRQPRTDEIVESMRGAVEEAPAAWSFVADVRDEESLRQIRDRLVAETVPIDVVIPNAGVNTRMPALDFPAAAVREIVDTNLLGVMTTLQTFVPLILDRGEARVIVTGSASAVHGMVLRAPYTATKAGLSGLVRSLALEWGPRGVTVNAVGPGIIRTPLTVAYMEQFPEKVRAAVANTPLRRIGTPEEVADVVLFLASRAARFITGQTIFVDGGLTAGSAWW